MTAQPPPSIGSDPCEARRSTLHRQIGVVATLILALSLVLAATTFLPQPECDFPVAPTTDGAPPARPGVESEAGNRLHFIELGRFAELAGAAALRARLEEHRFQATFETRLRLGPFVSRGEAQAAQLRLYELGFDSGVVVTQPP